MGKLLWLLLIVALAGTSLAAYNAFRYEIVQPFPLGWNHSEDELRLLDLERERRQLVAKMGSERRATSLAGLPLATLEDDDLKATLAAVDREIATLRARVPAPR